MTTTNEREACLPGAWMPVLVRACERALEHSDADGRLIFEAGHFDYLQNMTGIACLAAVLVTDHPANPLHGDDRLADLVRRAGRFMVNRHLDPKTNPPGHMWYDGRDVHEWAFEMWLTAYRALVEHGAADIAQGWEDGLRAGAAAFHRWCTEIEHVRTALSPNLHISPNHFGFFILNTLEAGLLFDLPAYRDLGLERARWLTRQQDPDGYWEETDGPTTSYNFISTSAVGWYYALTGEDLFLGALRRAFEFHTRYAYPDGCFLETIDQRVRYDTNATHRWNWVQGVFSHLPEGRALNERLIARSLDLEACVGHGFALGRIAKNVLNYQVGPVGEIPAEFDRCAARLTRPGGVVKDGTWCIGLSGIPSRPRPHRYTLDRQNCISVWHRDTGLIVGGGNARNQSLAATFHTRIDLDPEAVVDGVTQMDVYTPTRASLDLTDRGGTLAVGYWGFDGDITVDIVDDRALRLTAGAWGRKGAMPVFFSPNLKLEPGVPLVTASGREIAVDGTPFEVSANEMGAWFGQGRWRIGVPAGAVLTYPFRPYYPNWKLEDLELNLLYGILTVPLSNEAVTLEIRVA